MCTLKVRGTDPRLGEFAQDAGLKPGSVIRDGQWHDWPSGRLSAGSSRRERPGDYGFIVSVSNRKWDDLNGQFADAIEFLGRNREAASVVAESGGVGWRRETRLSRLAAVTRSDEPTKEPDLAFGPLRIWIRGRQLPDAQDYWDGNWLVVEARCGSPISTAKVTGPSIHLPELRNWLRDLRTLSSTIEGEATLATMEAEIEATVKLDSKGRGSLVVSLQQHTTESHEWTVQVDQSYLPGWIKDLEHVLSEYPIRGQP